MDTKAKIMDVALHMFSERGYEAVSIRDICGEVGIKESTLYYHYKNKQDILDSLFIRFEGHVNSLLNVLHSPDSWNNSKSPSFEWIDTYFFDRYLLDPFCNRMMRLMLIEQSHNKEIHQKYNRWLFEEPCRIEMSVFETLSQLGIMNAELAEQNGKNFYAYITMLVFRYLLNGKLTSQKKKAFREEAHSYIASNLGFLEGK
jgi:AcrR family transcriptional regulator